MTSSRRLRIGLMTGGGDAPGLNGIIEAASRVLLKKGCEVVGICDGFEGVFSGNTLAIHESTVAGIHAQAGTLLGTSNRTGTAGREAEFLQAYQRLKLDGLIAAGGDGTFRGLQAFADQIPVIGVPKTIDNDLSGTERTFGYDTACAVVAEAVDSLRFTAEAHRRIIVVETMGRTAGWIALGGGLAGYADAILIPEKPFDAEALVTFVKDRHQQGQRGLMVVVAEGAHPVGGKPVVAFRVEGSPEPERLGGVAEQLAHVLQGRTGWEARHTVLGHLQRARSPVPSDRFLTLEMGVQAAELALKGHWGSAVVVKRGALSRVPLSELMGPVRRVPLDHEWMKSAQDLGLFTG